MVFANRARAEAYIAKVADEYREEWRIERLREGVPFAASDLSAENGGSVFKVDMYGDVVLGEF